MFLKKALTLLLALSMLFSLVACGGKPKEPDEEEEVVDEMALRATSLQVNNLGTPMGIDTTPRFSWVNKSKTIGRAQTAYQIIVASTKELAEAHTGDLWDTGKVESDECFDIPYAGQTLTSRMDCYWSVRVWDDQDTASDWTKIARFGVGILDQSEWTAKWIGAPTYTGGKGVIPAPMLRKGFSLKKNIKNAKIYICGLGLFELKVNGTIPDDSVLNPADTQYEDTVSYCAYDVTSLLKKGKNAVTVELGCGFYDLNTDVSVGFYNGVWKDDPKLLLELHVEYENGNKEVIVSDESWRCYEDGPIRSNNIYTGEEYYADKEVEGWTDADFDDSSWKTARLATAPTGKLKFENMEPMRRVRSFAPVTVTQAGSNWEIRTPEFCTGWARISFPEAKKGEKITISYYQRDSDLHKGLFLDQGNGAGKVKLQSYTYRAKGVPGETYEPKFSYAGFQMIVIEGYSGELKPEDIVCYTVSSDVEHIGQFSSGSELVNSLHEMMVRSMVCNMQGKPTDTPIFEKLGWTGDYNGAIKTFNYNFDVTNFLRHFLYNLRDTGSEDGHLNEFSPTHRLAKYYSPCWTQMYVNSIYASWHENGQFSLVEEHYDYMRKNADYYIKTINGGIEPWIWESAETGSPSGTPNRLGDWASPNGSISPSTAPAEGGSLYNTAAVYRVLREMTEICTAMGDADAAEKYKSAADNIQANFNREYYNEENGCYKTDYWNGSQTRTRYRQALNLVALAQGLTTPENHDTVLENLVKDIAQKDNHADVGSVGAELILPVLSAEGYNDLALEILLNTDFPSWGYWIENGLTTCQEGWSLTQRSACHFFLGTYDEWLYQNLGGIQNPKDGYKTVTIRPEIYPELKHVNTSVNTVRGELVSNWKVEEDNRLTMTVTVPIGTTAEILLPVPEGHAVQLNGASLAVGNGVLEIGVSGDRMMVRVTSGTFQFDLGKY